MKKKIFLISILLTFIFSITSYGGEVNTTRKVMEEVINITNSIPVEYGVKAYIHNISSKDRETLNKDLSDFFNQYTEIRTSHSKAQWEQENLSLIHSNVVVNSFYNTSEEIFTFDILLKEEFISYKKELEKFMDNLESAYNLEKYEYIKAKLPEDNVQKSSESIKDYLIGIGSHNIKIDEIDRGVIGTANTHTYEGIYSKSRDFDFNFAMSKYNSGTYLIIGSPIISWIY